MNEKLSKIAEKSFLRSLLTVKTEYKLKSKQTIEKETYLFKDFDLSI